MKTEHARDVKTEHTPGPWDIQQLAHCTAIQAGPENRVCTLWDHIECEGMPCGSIEGQNKAQEEIEANAALIAAAPDLLEALVNWFECADKHDTLCRCGRDKARAAIAKAERRAAG